MKKCERKISEMKTKFLEVASSETYIGGIITASTLSSVDEPGASMQETLEVTSSPSYTEGMVTTSTSLVDEPGTSSSTQETHVESPATPMKNAKGQCQQCHQQSLTAAEGTLQQQPCSRTRPAAKVSNKIKTKFQ